MSARQTLIGEDPRWRDPLIGISEATINYHATAFRVGGYFMVMTFENYLRLAVMTDRIASPQRVQMSGAN